jgi:excisionase family DNA binding protein
MTDETNLISLKEAAERLGLCSATLRRMVRAGTGPAAVTPGRAGMLRFEPRAIVDHIRRRTVAGIVGQIAAA